MSGKVVLTKKQAEALEEAKKEFENDRIIKNHITGNGSEWLRQCSSLNGMTIDELIKAVYIGYETETTAEEKILNEYLRRDTGDKTDMAYQNGMEFVLCTLGVIIKRIND